MSQPVQPSDKLLDEKAKRVAYAALDLIEKELTKAATGGPVSYEKIEALSSATTAAVAAMAPPDEDGMELGD